MNLSMDPTDPAAVAAALDRVRRGDKDAYQPVVRAFGLLVRTFLCSQVYHLDDVDDLAQDVFLTAYRTLPTMPAEVEFGAWLRGIARNKVQNFRRGAARRNRAMEQFRETAARTATAEFEEAAAADRPDDVERLLECVGKLPDRLRRVVRAGLDGDKPVTLAADLGVTPAAVYNLHYRANRLLRDCVRNGGAAS